MPINQKCLERLRELGLPMDVVVKNPQGEEITNAIIDETGAVRCNKTNKLYDCPSLLRGDLIGNNRPTYKYLFFKGTSLHDLGVGPK